MKPRLQKHFEERVSPRLMEQFEFQNAHRVPRIEKIVINVGMGEAAKNPKVLDAVVAELGGITGQKAVVTRARKSISNFGLREDMPVGAKVTLRRERMYEFLDRLVNVAMPRIRDFQGLPTRSFDGRGNYSIGVKEQLIFPEIEYDSVDSVHGMDINVVTTTDKDDEAYALLREMGLPFRGETPLVVSGEEISGAAEE